MQENSQNTNKRLNVRRAWLTTNRTCNLKCDWCYAQNASSNLLMDYDKALNCINALSEMGVKTVVLIGGEPTLHPHFFDLIEYIKKLNLRVALTTNGLAFSDFEFAKKTVDCGIDSINISIKAPDENSYKKLTHSFGLTRTIKGYHNIVKAGFTPSLSYVLSPNSEDEVDNLVSLLVDNNLDHVLIQLVKPVLDKNNTDRILIDQLARMVEYIYQALSMTSISFLIELSIPFCSINRQILDEMLEKKLIKSCCHVQGGKGVVIDTNFHLLPCNHFVNMPISTNPISTNGYSFEKEFNSELATKFRGVAKKYPSIKCQTCSLWNICGGGCFTRWLFENPNLYI